MRFMLAGVSSGCGKTTATLAMLRALSARGLRVAPFKSGPDYIDPGFHRVACGRVSHNLDEWLCSPEAVKRILQIGARDADVAVVEGAMGMYDGAGSDSRCSAWSLSRHTGTPVVLVVDASGSAASAAATALGFLKYRDDSGIAGVFVNRVSGERHFELVREAMSAIGLPCVGWMPKDKLLHMPDRHLGLVPVEERPDVQAQIERAAGEIHIDMDALTAIARRAEKIDISPTAFPRTFEGKRIGLAKDAAFTFTYEANLIALREMGAELVEFSPLKDAALPDGLDALYVPGGFPEVFEAELRANLPMTASVKDAVEGGLKVYAECGGMLYLSMIGAIPVQWRMTDRLQRFGYVTVTDGDGYRFPAHEFHHSVTESALPKRFTVEKRGNAYPEGYVYKNALAGYPHIHFFERPELAERLFL
ncbi:MAG: cobyrinate a,c-diamide synthase [Clostridia bacterium]|nr:cobyrinate a,c-diamide synthase [Clostridia bacterium]